MRGRLAKTVAVLALATILTPAYAGAADAPLGPSVMLCLYDADGHMLAGHAECPKMARPSDAMVPEAHCFYDRQGRLWRGLPRCPRTAPPFLMEEAGQRQ
ncbi:hypothetical protein [uncultured Rhodospira sp.]|uniref:hypothetical protein n=1 Tax=uncultured Rhodospira sp. TaxID=1936189 RepID=UPI0026165928|nr:hypothetical protein [uncultured Rhodospira sp.]